MLLTGEGGLAQYLRGSGEYGHAATVLETKGDVLTVLSSDNRGIYIETNADASVGGRTWDVFRVRDLNVGKFQSFARGLERGGGLAQYVGNNGGNVCSSVCARAIEFGGGPIAPRAYGNLVTPNALANTYGPPIGRITTPRLYLH